MAKRIAMLMLMLLADPAGAQTLGSPVACTLGTDCYVQQFPDVDPGAGATDPFCGEATYDGHDGTDLRLRSLPDIAGGVAVIAVGDGTVLRGRDGEPDRLVATAQDRAAVAAKECGNGLILDLGDGMEAQYCHMRQGSLVVKPGQQVRKGDKLGEVGASGMAEFPHVHLSVRQQGKPVDPSTGRLLTAGCETNETARKPLWAPEVAMAMGAGQTQLLGMGLAAGPVDHNALAKAGMPASPDTGSPNLVGWVWLINLDKDDRVRIDVTAPDGSPFASSTTAPMDRAKAAYSAFAGKRGSPSAGAYSVTVRVIRAEQAVLEKTSTVTIR